MFLFGSLISLFAHMMNIVFFRCCELGCLSGAAVVQSMGAEINADGWTWVHAHMHEGRAQALVRGSAAAVQAAALANAARAANRVPCLRDASS